MFTSITYTRLSIDLLFMTLSFLSGSDADFGKEFLSFLLEPLKYTDTVYLKYETVFLLRITFKFRL